MAHLRHRISSRAPRSSDQGPAAECRPLNLPLSTHVLDAQILFRTATINDVESVLRSHRAVGGNRVWWLFHDDYNKIDLVLNQAPYIEAVRQQHARLELSWSPSVSGHVYVKGTAVERSACHLRALLQALLGACDGIVASARSDAGPSSVFNASALNEGRNASGMSFEEMVGRNGSRGAA
jgi:hypothetical protein